MPQITDLSLITTSNLLAELAQRHEAVAVALSNHDQEVTIYLHGHSLLCAGLAVLVQDEILRGSSSDVTDAS